MDPKGYETKPWWPYLKNMYDEVGGDMLDVDAKGYEEKPWWPYVLDLQEKIDEGGGGGSDSALDSYLEGTITEIRSNAKELYYNACVNLKQLKRVYLPECTKIGGGAFESCNSLKVIDTTASTFSASLHGCIALDTLVLRSETKVYIGPSSFTYTKFASGNSGGKIYVPSNLLDAYLAENWVTTVLGKNTNNKILSIEGSEYE